MLESYRRMQLLVAGTLLMALWVGPVHALDFGETVVGSISSRGETDSYTFSANAGDTVLIRMSKSSGGIRPEVRLYGPVSPLSAEKRIKDRP